MDLSPYRNKAAIYPPVSGQRQTINSLFVDWKQTILSSFVHGSFVLDYADSSDERDFFLHGLLILGICPIKSVEYA